MCAIAKADARQIVGDWLRSKRDETGLGRVRFEHYCEELGCQVDFGDALRFWECGRQMPDSAKVAELLQALEPDLQERHRIIAARLYLDPKAFTELLGLQA